MSEFDRQNEDVFQIVHDNPRRRGVIRTVGYIVSREQAERFAAFEAAQKRGDRHGLIMMVLAVIAVLGTALMALMR